MVPAGTVTAPVGAVRAASTQALTLPQRSSAEYCSVVWLIRYRSFTGGPELLKLLDEISRHQTAKPPVPLLKRILAYCAGVRVGAAESEVRHSNTSTRVEPLKGRASADTLRQSINAAAEANRFLIM